MSAKDNFNQAMSDMFGVGKDSGLSSSAKSKEPAKDYNYDYSASNYSVTPATYLAAGTIIEGTIHSTGDVEIVGELRGDVDAQGKVTLHTDVKGNVTASDLSIPSCNLTGDVHCSGRVKVGPSAIINGNIYAAEITCSGQVVGDIDVAEHVTLEETAIVNGTIRTATMSMSRGAIIRGGIEMREPKPKQSVYLNESEDDEAIEA